MENQERIDVSIVIPVYNEEENLPLLFKEIKKVVDNLSRVVEIIFIDDGSQDSSFGRLKEIAEKESEVRVIKFKKNFGQTAALAAGFNKAKGDVIITLDADLQNDPRDIPRLLKEIDAGYDLVSGWRRHRKDPFFSKKLPSYFANKIISFYTGVKLNDYGCTLKAYRRKLLAGLNLYGELHRFIPALVSWAGASIKEVEVNHNRRKYGKSNYTIFKITSVVLDLSTVKFMLAVSRGPMQIFGRIGLFSIFLGFICGVTALFMRVFQVMNLTGNPLLYVSIFFGFVGLQFISIGLLGEINLRTYTKSANQKFYKIEQEIGSS